LINIGFYSFKKYILGYFESSRELMKLVFFVNLPL